VAAEGPGSGAALEALRRLWALEDDAEGRAAMLAGANSRVAKLAANGRPAGEQHEEQQQQQQQAQEQEQEQQQQPAGQRAEAGALAELIGWEGDAACRRRIQVRRWVWFF
jgi:hypothetical protein